MDANFKTKKKHKQTKIGVIVVQSRSTSLAIFSSKTRVQFVQF